MITKQQFAIKDLEILSGIHAHTLRMWEKRYNILVAPRNQGNIRMYTLDHVNQLLHIIVLMRQGYKISALSRMDIAALEAKLATVVRPDLVGLAHLHLMIMAYYTNQLSVFQRLLQDILDAVGVASIADELIIPFAVRTQLTSVAPTLPINLVVHSLFAQLLERNMATFPPLGQSAPLCLMFLPKGAAPGLLFSFARLSLAKQGIRVVFTPSPLNPAQLQEAIKFSAPQSVATILSGRATFLQPFATAVHDTMGSSLMVFTSANDVDTHLGTHIQYVKYNQYTGVKSLSVAPVSSEDIER
jgi:DNA-binding transcriptional MerR regulator